MSYILNDDFNGGKWTDASGTVHSGSSGVAGSLPSASIWNVKQGSSAGFEQGAEYYVNSTNIIKQDGASNLNFYVGAAGTDGAQAGTYPTAACDTGTPGALAYYGTGTAPNYVVKPGQSVEWRVKIFPLAGSGEGSGAWPACWLIGANATYPAGWEEIDVQESGDANIDNSYVDLWGGDSAGQKSFTKGMTVTGQPVGDGNYHVFRCDLLNDGATVSVFYDGTQVFTCTQAQGLANIQSGYGVTDVPWTFTNAAGLFVALDVAVGGVGTTYAGGDYGYGSPAASSLPALVMSVDYVRIWSPAGPDPNSGNTTTAGSVALAPLAVAGTAASAAAGTFVASGSVALAPLATAATVNGGTGGGGGGSTASLTDAFASSATSTNWGNSYGTFAASNAWFSMQSDTTYSTGLSSTSTYNLTGSYFFARVLPYIYTDSETALQLYLDANDTIAFAYSGGDIAATVVQGGVVTQSPFVAYNAVNHAWWRIREASGVLYFDTAPDGATWTNFWSTPYTMTVTALYAGAYTGVYSPGTVTGTAYLTDVNVVPAAAAALTDGFDIDDRSTLWAWSYGTTAVANSECSIQADTAYDSGIVSTVNYNLTASSAAAQMLPFIATSGETGLEVSDAAGNNARIYLGGTVLTAQLVQGGMTTAGTPVTYSATNHSWWRIREALGTLYFETAPDGLTWTLLWSTTYTFSVTALYVQVYAGDYGTDATGSAYVTNVNTSGTTCAGSVALAPLATAGAVGAGSSANTTSTGSVALAPLAVTATAAQTPPLGLVGTPSLVRSTSGSVTSAFGTGQTDTAGDLLIAVATAAAATSVTAPACSTSGWTEIVGEGNAASTPHAYVSMWFKVAAGSDTAPVFTSTLSGTGAMTATLYEITSYDTTGTTGWLDSTGVYASGASSATLAAISAATATTTYGPLAIGASVQERAAGTNTWNNAGTSGFANSVNDGTTNSVAHTAIDVSTSTGEARGAEGTVTDTGHWTTDTAAYAAAIVVVFFPATAAGGAAFQLRDTFVTNDLATVWGGTYGTVTVSGSKCNVQCDTSYSSGVGSTSYYDIRGAYVYAQMFPYIAASAETGLQLYNDQGNLAVIAYSGGDMIATLAENGVTTSAAPVAYSATNHAWWQITESAGTLYFQTAPDGVTWTTLWSTAYTFDASAMDISVYTGDYGSDPTGTSSFTNVNTTGSTTATGSVALAPLAVAGTAAVNAAGTFTATGSVALAPLAVAGAAGNYSGPTVISAPVALAPLAVAGAVTVVNPPLAFPLTLLDVLVELYVNGAWTNITDYVYQRDNLVITRGRPNEASAISPSTLSITLNNRDGRFSPRNPTGPYFGTLGRNTQMRISAPVDAVMDSLGYRFWGEVPAWPPQWDNTGNDVYVQIQVAGITRRLSQSGAAVLASSMTRYYTSATGPASLVAYWPCEDAVGSTSLASAVAGDLPMGIRGAPTLASDSSFAGSGPIPVLNGSIWTASIGSSAPNAVGTDNVLRFLMHIPAAGDVNGATVAAIFTSGTVTHAYLQYGTVGGGSLQFTGYDVNGNALFQTAVAPLAVTGVPVRVSVALQTVGTGVEYSIQVLVPGASSALATSGTITSASIGRFTGIAINPDGQLVGTSIGQISVQSVWDDLFNEQYALNAWIGESAAARFTRLCTEESIASAITGNTSDGALMGAQTMQTLLDLLQECESADLGQIYEPRTFFGLAYRTRVDMCNQAPVCALDYSQAQLAAPLAPTDDDQLIVNDVTVTRTSGSSLEVTQTTGALSTSAPPAGVGPYPKSYTVNLQSDSQLPAVAGWLLSIGTVDQQRFPAITVDLTRPQVIAAFGTVQAADVGDLITIANPPAWMPPELIQQLAVGWTETLNAFMWTVEWNCVPALPYFTGVVGANAVYGKAGTDGSELYTNITSSATSMLVETTSTSYPLWTTATSDFPFDVIVSGERITVSKITGSSSPQTFTVARSVNGVVKSHLAGEPVSLFYPATTGI